MVDLWAVVVLVVGVVLSFTGVFMALASSTLKKPVAALHDRVDRHDVRILDLERQDAARTAQLQAIAEGVTDLKRMLEKHTDNGR